MFHNKIVRELAIILVIKIVALTMIYQWWFSDPVPIEEINIQTHLLGK